MTAKLKGTPEWVLQIGYPKVTKESVDFKYIALISTLSQHLPEYGDGCPETGLTPLSEYGDWVLKEKPHEPLAGDMVCEVNLKYQQRDENKDPIPDSGIPVYSATTSTFEKPIATHPNYKTFWNYCLARKIGCTAPFNNYQEATGVLVADAENFKWVSDPNSLPDGWKIVTDRGKSGVEAYLYPSSVIQEKRFYTSMGRADNALADVAKLKVPPVRFGLSNGAEHWMCMGASVQKEGEYWTATKTYQFLDKWDEDIYNV